MNGYETGTLLTSLSLSYEVEHMLFAAPSETLAIYVALAGLLSYAVALLR